MFSQGQGHWGQSNWQNDDPSYDDGSSWQHDEASPFDASPRGSGFEDGEGWEEEDRQEAAGTDDRSLAAYDAPQPSVRPGRMSAALMRLAGESRALRPLEPRATGPMLVPGRGKTPRPGSFSHSPFSPRAHRPRPLLLILFLMTLALLTITTTAWAALPIDTKTQAYNAFISFSGLAAPAATTKADYFWYIVLYGDTLESIASKFGVSPNGILLKSGLESSDQLYVGLRLKIPTDPNYGKNAPVGVVDIPPPPPDKAGNVFGTNPWNSTSGPTTPNGICAPAGNADTLAHRQAFQLIMPNPGAHFVRGFTSYHNGVDIAQPSGVPIFAAQAGMVVFAGWDNLGLGWSVKLNHCNGLSTLYGHMLHPPLVKAGDYVTVGQQVGQEGSTGNSTGPHLHFMTEWWNKSANPYCFDFQLPAGNTPCTAP